MASSFIKSACASTSAVVTAYVGKLRSDCTVKQLENEIQSLFQTVGVFVDDDDVKARRKSAKKPAFAFVNLKDKSTFDYVVEKLNGLPSVSKKVLIFPGANLEISLARKNVSNSSTKISPAKTDKTRKHPKKAKHKLSSEVHLENHQPAVDLAIMGKGSGSMATGFITIATSTTTLATSNATMETDMLNGSEFVTLNPMQRYYFAGQKLRTEDRLTEYKQGGGNYIDLHFKIHLAKYVCAFLNSEGGTLMVGVQDDCTVCGIKISSKKEDLLRLEIDQIMKGFNPPVFTGSYAITFVPVYRSPVVLGGTFNQAANSLDIENTVPLTNNESFSTDSAAVNPTVNIINSNNEGSNSLDISNVSSVPIVENNYKDCHPFDTIQTSSVPVTKANFINAHSSDVLRSHSTPEPSSSENNKEKIQSEQYSPTCVSKRLPPLMKPSLLSSDVSNKLEWGNVESSNKPFGGEGHNHGNEIFERVKAIKTDLKVIEVKVHHIEDSSTLYETNKGEVYIRRDGSIQGPLKASQILAWSRQNINKNHHLERTQLRQEIVRKQDEIEMNMKLVNELVKQKQFVEEQYQEKIEKLKENEDKLHAEISLLRNQEAQAQNGNHDIQRNRSKVCTII